MSRAEALPSISVVLCAFDPGRAAWLRDAVMSLEHQDERPEEVIVVIDHAPGLLERMRADLPGALVIANSERRGLAGARNSGVAASSGDVVAFLDDDAVAASDWIPRLRRAYDDPQVSGAGGSIVPTWTDGRPGWFPAEFDWVVGCTYRGLPVAPARVRNLIGCNMSFRREAIVAVGGFADGLGRVGSRPLGCEETDLCIRIGRLHPDRHLLYDPRAVVRHRVTQERATVAYFVSRCFGEGVSKREIARRSGRAEGLSSERDYLRSTLPAGVRRGIGAAVRHREPAGIARAGAIALGVAVTGAGFMTAAVPVGWAA